MKSALIYSLVAMILTWAQVALAQSTVTRQVWIQLETRLHLEASLDRIEIYARDLDNVNGFEIGGGWFGVAIGPYDPEQADAALQKFRAEGIIPRTSFTTSGSSYGERSTRARARLKSQHKPMRDQIRHPKPRPPPQIKSLARCPMGWRK